MLIISGGAIGADALFGDIDNTTCIACSFAGHDAVAPRNGKIIRIAQHKLNLKYQEYIEVCTRLNKNPTKNAFVRNLMLRNMYQISQSEKHMVDMVIAISDLTADNKNCTGGTAYAVARAILNKIEYVILLNKSDYKFYEYSYSEDKFIELSGNIDIDNGSVIAGIGSRVIDNRHIAIIRNTFRNRVITNCNGGI